MMTIVMILVVMSIIIVERNFVTMMMMDRMIHSNIVMKRWREMDPSLFFHCTIMSRNIVSIIC